MNRAGIVVLVASLVAGCGGGGGSGGPSDETITVTYDSSPARACTTVGYDASIHVVGTLSRVPEELSRVNVYVAGDALDVNAVLLSSLGDNRFSLDAPALESLSVGEHTGSIWFELCRDAACAQKYRLTGEVLPYSVTIAPFLELAVRIDSAPVEIPYSGDIPFQPGQALQLTSNIPVTWSKGSSMGNADIVMSSQDDTTWNGTLTGSPGNFVGIIAQPKCGRVGAQVLFGFPYPWCSPQRTAAPAPRANAPPARVGWG